MSTLMDESSLMRLSSSTDAFETMSMVEASQHFRYFVVDRSILLGILEDSFFSEDEPPPTVRTSVNSCLGLEPWPIVSQALETASEIPSVVLWQLLSFLTRNLSQLATT